MNIIINGIKWTIRKNKFSNTISLYKNNCFFDRFNNWR